MTVVCPISAAGDVGGGPPAALGLAKWLGLAAAPTFAFMAVLSAVLGGGGMDMVCSAGGGSWPGGMVLMYALMSAFHASAWLKRFSGR